MIEGQQLLNISIIVTSLLVVTCWIILWPVLRILFADKNTSIPESMKVKICSHTNMTEDFNRESRRYVDFSVRLDFINIWNFIISKLVKGFDLIFTVSFLDQNYKSLHSVFWWYLPTSRLPGAPWRNQNATRFWNIEETFSRWGATTTSPASLYSQVFGKNLDKRIYSVQWTSQ